MTDLERKLRELKLWTVFKTAFEKACLYNRSLESFLKESSNPILQSAFVWKNSRQGHKFWSEINHKLQYLT